MAAAALVCLSALGWVAHAPGVSSGLRRCAAPRCDQYVRSDGTYDWFRRKSEVAVSVEKPLGTVLEECSPGGVRVEEVMEGGSAFETKLLKKGDRLLRLFDTDVSAASFDEVMGLLGEAPETVELAVERTVLVRKKMVKPVLTVDGALLELSGSGKIMRTEIVKAGIELYKGMNKLTNCGGGGQCASCWVDVREGAENLSPPTAVELQKIAPQGKRPATYRMSCQCVVNGDCSVAVPSK
jgi:ferredoxin